MHSSSIQNVQELCLFFLLQFVTRCSIAVRGDRNCVRLSFDLLSEHFLTKWSQSTSFYFYGLFPYCHLSRIEDLVFWLHNSDHRIVTSIRLDIKFFIMLRSSEENGETLLSVQNFNVLPKWRLWRTIRRICVWCSGGSGNLRMVERQCATDDTTLPRGPKCPWG